MEIRGEGMIQSSTKMLVYVSQAKLRRKACVGFSIHKETLILSRQLKSPPHYSQKSSSEERHPVRGMTVRCQRDATHRSV